MNSKTQLNMPNRRYVNSAQVQATTNENDLEHSPQYLVEEHVLLSFAKDMGYMALYKDIRGLSFPSVPSEQKSKFRVMMLTTLVHSVK